MRRIPILTFMLLKSWVRSRSGLFFSFAFPIMLLLIFGSVFGGGTTQYTLYIQNLDVVDGQPTELSQAFIDALNSTKLFNLKTIPVDADPIEYAVADAGKLRNPRILIIHEGFHENVINGSIVSRVNVMIDTMRIFLERFGEQMPEETRENITQGLRQLEDFRGNFPDIHGRITLVVWAGDQAAPIIEGIVRNMVNAFNMRLIGGSEVIEMSNEVVEKRVLKPVDYYLPGLISAFIFTNGVIGLSSIISDFRRRGVIKKFATTPLSRLEWILSNIVLQGLLGLILTGFMMAVALLVFGVKANFDALTMLVIFIGAMMSSGIGMMVGGALKDPEAASAAGNAIAFPMMFLSGAFWPIDFMPRFLQELASFLPLTYFAQALRDSMIHLDLASALLNLGVVAAFMAVFITMGSLMTRWKEP